MPEDGNSRKQLHIFVDEPVIYAGILPELYDGSIDVLYTYEEFADAISCFEEQIFTTQIVALSHVFIRLGYDIYLYDNSNIIKFGEVYLELLEEERPIQSYGYYYMLDLYRLGELYQCE